MAAYDGYSFRWVVRPDEPEPLTFWMRVEFWLRARGHKRFSVLVARCVYRD